MCPKLAREVEETKDGHRLSKKVGDSTISSASSESLDILQPHTAPKPPGKLHRIRAKGGVDDQLEMVQSSPESLHVKRWPQTTPPRPAPAKLSRSTVMNFDCPTTTAQIASLALDNKSLLSKDHMSSLQAPFDQSDVSLMESDGRPNSVKSSESHESGSILEANNQYYGNLQTNEDPRQGDAPTDLISFMQQPFLYKPANQMRYYSRALSEEDKQALAAGEKNYNLKEWNAGDLVRFHESRLELVPRSLEDRDAVIKDIQKDKENAERYFLRADMQVSRFPVFCGRIRAR